MNKTSSSRPRFRLYVERTFSRKFDDTLAFVSENWRPLLKYITLVLLPVCIVQGLCLEGLVSALSGMGDSDVSDSALVRMGASYLGTVIFYLAGGMLLSAVVYALMRIYLRRDNRLVGLDWAQCKTDLKYCLRREAKVVAVFVGISIVAVALFVGFVAVAAAVGSVGLLLILFPVSIGLLVVLMPLMLAFPIVAFTDTSVGGAFRKAWRLGFGTWWSMFAFLAVVMLVVSVMCYMLSLPWTICYALRVAFIDETASASLLSWAPLLSVLGFIFGVGMVYVNYLLSSLVMVALAVQYGHASEKMEGTSVENAIDEFEEQPSDVDDVALREIDEFENL